MLPMPPNPRLAQRIKTRRNELVLPCVQITSRQSEHSLLHQFVPIGDYTTCLEIKTFATTFRVRQFALVHLFMNMPLFLLNFFVKDFCVLLTGLTSIFKYFRILNLYFCNARQILLSKLGKPGNLITKQQQITESVR